MDRWIFRREDLLFCVHRLGYFALLPQLGPMLIESAIELEGKIFWKSLAVCFERLVVEDILGR